MQDLSSDTSFSTLPGDGVHGHCPTAWLEAHGDCAFRCGINGHDGWRHPAGAHPANTDERGSASETEGAEMYRACELSC